MRVIIRAKEGVAAAAALTLSDENREHLPLIDAVAADLPEGEIAELRARGYEVMEDGVYRVPPIPQKQVSAEAVYPSPECDPTTPGPMRQMADSGVVEVHQDGYRGAGVVVGIADSGIDATHPDLIDALRDYRDFTGGGSEPRDPCGHGTAVSGVVAGRGLIVDKFHGVAPAASVVMARVLGDDGSGYTSDIIRGLDWLVAQGVDIINISLGSPDTGYDALSMAVDAVCERGVLVVVAAGNDGPHTRIQAPANAERCICVVACDQEGRHSDFSCVGPATTLSGDSDEKPTIMAWGENVVMPLSRDSTPMGIRVGEYHVVADGTSFAAPFVSGCAALYLEVVNDLEHFEVYATDAADASEEYTLHQEGAGRIDIYEAICDALAVDAIPDRLDDSEGPSTNIIDPATPWPPGCLLGIIGWLRASLFH